jgi:hypothetical protein
MSSHTLTTFTDKPDYSFGRALPVNSMMPCDPLLLDTEDPEADNWWMRFPVGAHSDGMEAFIDVCVPPGSKIALTTAETYRLFCHILIQNLPATAFEEAVESLSGMYEYYLESPTSLPAPPVESMKARITGSYLATVYPIIEE